MDYAKRAKKSDALRNLNFHEESPQMGRPQIDCLRADVSYFLCCTRKRDVPFPRATKEIGDVCTQATN